MKNDHDQIEVLLNQALEFKPEERAAYLADACREDHDLRQKVEPYKPACSRIDPFMFGVEKQSSAKANRNAAQSHIWQPQ